MARQPQINPWEACRSVFRSGEKTTTKSQFTNKWIELINQLEKSKRITADKRE